MEPLRPPLAPEATDPVLAMEPGSSRFLIPISVILSALTLCLLSIPQKIILGADPFSLRGFIVPGIFGSMAGMIIGALFVRNRKEYSRRIRIQQEATQELIASEKRFRLLAENARDVIFLWSLKDHRYEYISPSVYNLTGHLPEEFYVDPNLFISIVHREDRARIESISQDVRKGELPPSLEYRLHNRDGQTVWINQRHTISLDREGQPHSLEGICTDVSAFHKATLEKNRLEQQLYQAQKMEAIGRLAGGIAHDFNNLLTVINGYVDLLLHSGSLGEEQITELNEIRKAGRKAADLTNHLLAFSRNQVANPQPLLPGDAVLESLKMIKRVIDEAIEIRTEIAENLPSVFIDPTQLDQILLNLVLNARDALDKSGTIVIQVKKGDLSGEFCNKCRVPLKGEFLILAVSDNGCGIPAENLDRIFEPFFTTKEVGQGTGLGLSTVFGVVHQIHGHVQVTSQVGHGSTFTVLIPLLAGDSIPSRPDLDSTTELKGEGETILIVEDEDLVRSLAATLLKQHGYNILLAGNGQQALRIISEPGQKVDLVLTDIVMPEMDGIELANRLQSLAPATRILFMSGYLDETLDTHAFDQETMSLLKKPFGAEELVRRVKQMLKGLI